LSARRFTTGRGGNHLASASGFSGGSGELVAVRVTGDYRHRAPLALPRRCRAIKQGGRDVYIGIGTVLAVIVIILLLIWIF
jgi:hypothetical protein